jgi:hypothetical protein
MMIVIWHFLLVGSFQDCGIGSNIIGLWNPRTLEIQRVNQLLETCSEENEFILEQLIAIDNSK